jgi:glycine cleavage system H protein
MAREYPDDLRYTKDHEWARIDLQKKRAIVGITAFAVGQLGDITQVDLPKEGEKVHPGKVIATVESVKAVSDIYSPLSGSVVKSNDPLRDGPETLNEDCYDEGWICELELTKPEESDKLMTAAEYEQYLREHG